MIEYVDWNFISAGKLYQAWWSAVHHREKGLELSHGSGAGGLKVPYVLAVAYLKDGSNI